MLQKFLHPKAGPAPFLIAGLGNPGREYRENRHNIGFMVVDRLCQTLSISISKVQSKALTGTGQFSGHKIILAKPQTYMNLSGQSISGLARYYKIPVDQILVAHDDIDLPLGTLRLRPGGGSGGQKGIASTIEQLGTGEFARMRIGIGRPPGQMEAAAYVLQNFNAQERDFVDATLDRAVKAAQAFIERGLEAAMNLYNGGFKEG
jgi:peptidyl-tRNA hydrolase, PTH1 family